MLVLLASGMICLTACKFENIEIPVNSCVISFDKMSFNCGLRSLNVKSENVGDWVDTSKNIYGDLSEIPEKELVCFYTSEWLTIIKPTLKKNYTYYSNSL